LLLEREPVEVLLGHFRGWDKAQSQIGPTLEERDQAEEGVGAKAVVCVVLLVRHEDKERVHQHSCEQVPALDVAL